ncbi:hypothetical protein [Streptomyces sp. NRRL S-455]|uniref:hypothetical protein n=1 Tax=Streptomyces sp. NRRL S-455 TaxID=1463908 RepID=UPI0004BEF1A9|nr:hypothetical protein [Streptomyces sp. NRRL S-455]
MTHFQTCRRHPEAGRFLRDCYGCKRDLFDMQARNEAEAQARKALALIGSSDVEILSAQAVGTALVVATHNPAPFVGGYAVDVFRLPTAAETDPDLSDDYRLPAGQWVLNWQAWDEVDTTAQMTAEARAYLATA